MRAASILDSVVAWLGRGTPPSFENDATRPACGCPVSQIDTFGNPIGDDGKSERHQRDIEDRAREHQILISCWM